MFTIPLPIVEIGWLVGVGPVRSRPEEHPAVLEPVPDLTPSTPPREGSRDSLFGRLFGLRGRAAVPEAPLGPEAASDGKSAEPAAEPAPEPTTASAPMPEVPAPDPLPPEPP